MKKLSLLSLLWVAGLLAFTATPIYAQDEEGRDSGEVIYETDDVAVEGIVVDELAADNEIAAEDVSAEPSFEEMLANDPELMNNLNAGLDDMLATLEQENEGITDEFNSQFTTDEERAAAAVGLLAIFAGFGLIAWLIAFVCWIIKTIALWKAFKKAWEAGWKAIIPIYHFYIEYKIAGMKNWFWYGICIAILMWIIAACIPDQQELLTNLGSAIVWIIYMVVTFKFARKFGWGVFTSVLFVLFYPICILILGFGSSKYQGKKETVVEA